jgi:hypothetical protein
MLGSAPDRKPNQGADKQNQLDPFEGLQFAKLGVVGLGVTIFAGIVANYVKRPVNELMEEHKPSGVYLSGDASVKSLEENNKDKVTTEELKDTPVELPPLPKLLER